MIVKNERMSFCLTRVKGDLLVTLWFWFYDGWKKNEKWWFIQHIRTSLQFPVIFGDFKSNRHQKRTCSGYDSKLAVYFFG